jgi:hypothetical protein
LGESFHFETKFGECINAHGWTFPREISIFEFPFDYSPVILEYNRLIDVSKI